MGSLDNSEEENWFKIALYDKNNGNFDEALKSCNQILGFNKNFLKAWVLSCILNHKMGRDSKVLEVFNKIKEFNISDQDYWIEIALEFEKNDDISNAINALDRSLKFNEEKKESLIKLAENYQTLGFSDKAYTFYKKALNKDPMDMDLLYKIGSIYDQAKEAANSRKRKRKRKKRSKH